jgi:hypothetical protein
VHRGDIIKRSTLAGILERRRRNGSGSQNGKRDVARSRGGCPSAGGDVSLPSSAPGSITTPGFVDPNVSAAMKKNPFGNDPVIAVAAPPLRRA